LLGGSETGAEADGRKVDDAGGHRRLGRLEEPLLEDPLASSADSAWRLGEEDLLQAATESEELS
jgi:hypothetical protein